MKVGDICLLKDPDAFRAEWRLARVTATFPDKHENVRNVEVKVVPSQGRSRDYQSVKPNYLKRHVSNLIVIVPVEDQNENENNFENDDKELDAEEVHDVIENESGGNVNENDESNEVEDKEINDGQSNDEIDD